MALPAGEFFTRWITHLCAPTFLFLAGTALALSVERRVAKGANAWEIDKSILTRGAIIALLDPTIISLGSGRWTFQVLLAIGALHDVHGAAAPAVHPGAARTGSGLVRRSASSYGLGLAPARIVVASGRADRRHLRQRTMVDQVSRCSPGSR